MTAELDFLDPIEPQADQKAETPNEEPTEQEEETGDKDQSTTPPVVETEKPKQDNFVPINALLDEREKRQRLESELAQLKAQAAPVAKDEITEDDLFSNPAEVLKRVQLEAYQAARRDMINMSEAILFETKPDAQEKIDAFKEAIQQNPSLYQQMIQHPNPAGFAYQEGTRHLSQKSMPQDMGKYEQELRAKIEAELAAKYGQKTKADVLNAPTVLSDVPNVKPGSTDSAFNFDALFPK
jgi:hypothetical protein